MVTVVLVRAVLLESSRVMLTQYVPGSENLRCRCTSHSEDGGTSSHVTARTSVQLGSDTMVQAETGMLTSGGERNERKSDADVIPVGDGRCAMH